jgi:hypothetical protein
MNDAEFAKIMYAAARGGYKVPPVIEDQVLARPPARIQIEEQPKYIPIRNAETAHVLAGYIRESQELRKVPLKHPATRTVAQIPPKTWKKSATVAVAKKQPPLQAKEITSLHITMARTVVTPASIPAPAAIPARMAIASRAAAIPVQMPTPLPRVKLELDAKRPPHGSEKW